MDILICLTLAIVIFSTWPHAIFNTDNFHAIFDTDNFHAIFDTDICQATFDTGTRYLHRYSVFTPTLGMLHLIYYLWLRHSVFTPALDI